MNPFWMIRLAPNGNNGLSKASAVDTFQIRSLSARRFDRKIGRVSGEELEEICSAVAALIEYA